MRAEESCEVDDALYFKPENESFYFSVIFSLTPEIKIKGEEESNSFEGGHDKKKCKLVTTRVAFEDKLAELPD